MNRSAVALVSFVLAGVTLACGRAEQSSSEAHGEAPADTLASEAAEMLGVTYDWLIHGATVVDGSGAPSSRTDVLLLDGRIAHVGPVDPATVDALQRFDATGLVLAPGFIDPHAHGDPLEDPQFANFLAMGVTTILLGQDGSSPEAAGLSAYLERMAAAGPWVNVAYLAGHNTIRRESGVGFGEPGPDGLARMAGLLDTALDAGAFGLSTGLEYDPGTRATLEELVAIAEPVAARDGVIMSHMRNEDADQVEASLAELIEQGRRSGARVHVSHLKIVLGSDVEQAIRILRTMQAAREEGLQVTADVYPYTASFTGIGILFPEWARPPNDYRTVVAERGDALAEYLRLRVEARNGPGATLFGSGRWSGRTLEEVAEELGRPFEQVLVELGPGGARAAYFVMDDEVMATLLDDPYVAVSSDGSPTMAHPRGYGSFARVIREHVTDRGRLSLEEAVRKMTGLTASIIGLDDPERVAVPRGLLREGWAADLVAFDPTEVRDRAEYADPHRLAEGMRWVWVGGELAWTDGAPVEGAGSGRVLRSNGSTPSAAHSR